MAEHSKELVELVAELIIEQKESRRELVTVFNTGFNLLAEKIGELRTDVNEMKDEIVEMKGEIVEMKGEITEIKHDVRSIDQRLERFENEQVLPRLLDLEHRLSIVERKVA